MSSRALPVAGISLRPFSLQPNLPPRLVQACSVPILGVTNSRAGETTQGTADKRIAAALGALALGGATLIDVGRPAMCEESRSTPVSAEKPAEATMLQKLIAEAMGTGIIVFGGCGAVAAKMYCNSGMGLGPLAVVWGMSVALAAYATRDISGAHLNPAVSAALAVNKPDAFPKEHLLPYWIAQVFGATVAGALNFVIFHAAISSFEAEKAIVRGAAASSASYAGAFGMIPNAAYVTPLGAFFVEVVATAALMFLIFSLTDSKGTVPEGAAPALIGATVATLISVVAPLTGAGFNPARDLGPRLVSFYVGWGAAALPSWWVYTAGPLVGGVIGGALYQATCAKK